MENVLMGKNSFFIAFFVLFLLTASALVEAAEIIVINPGHGGYDSGIRAGNINEKDTALALSKRIEEILKGLKKNVYLTRKIDQYLTIRERVALTNGWQPDIFISIHFSDSQDFSVYVMKYEEQEANLNLKQYYDLSSRQRKYLYDSSILAGIIGDIFYEGFDARVYYREMPLPLLSSIGAPAVHIEVPSQGIDYEKEMFRVASGIVLGILYYEEQQ